MVINYNIDELKTALLNFYIATGSAIGLVDSDFNMVISIKKPVNSFCEMIQSVPYGNNKCKCSDEYLFKKCALSLRPERHICHAGLIDTALPIKFNDTVAGYIILGQMRVEEDFNNIYNLISDLGINYNAAKNAYDSICVSSEDRIKSVCSIAVMLIQYIIFKNMITELKNKRLNDAVMYISNNLDKNLSVSKMCKDLNISKSALYGMFHRYKGCTVGEYINKKRIELAKVLLINSDKLLCDIACLTGFSDYAYFSKSFKKITGSTPFKYRKENGVK